LNKFVNKKNVNKNLAINMLSKMLQESRNNKGWVVRQLGYESGIDPALVSKFEKGQRIPTEENLKSLALALEISFEALRKAWLAEKIYKILEHESNASEILSLAESRVEYLSSKKALQRDGLGDGIRAKLEIIDALKDEWTSKKPLNKTQLKKMQEFFMVSYTYESNRIEGNTLSLQETHLVVNEGITIGGKSMKEHLEAINHSEAIAYIEQLVADKMDFGHRVLMELHYLILKGIDKENAGRFRKVPVRISGSAHLPPQPYMLDKLMEDYFIHYDAQKHLLHPVILASKMHERLVSIHPFIDGNGRTSRLVMNLILLKHGLTIANLKGDLESRLAYYKALESVQIDNNPDIFYHLVADAVIQSLKSHLEMV
jgi:fido (protein-threonine AMPylation protein)